MTQAAFLQWMDLLGVAVFAVSGALAACRKDLDALGVLVVATVTAVGGGTLRDLLLDRHPVFWMSETRYLWTILAATLATLVLTRLRRIRRLRALLVFDALGLAVFALTGAQIAERAGFGGVVTVILGTMSGTVGGMLRDVLTTEIPLVLRDRDVYTTAAIAGIVVYLLLQSAGIARQPAAWSGMGVVVGLRFAAIFAGLRLPALGADADQRR